MAASDQIGVYYSHLVSALGRSPNIDVVAVAHMVPNTLSFAPALNDLAHLAAILPKPKSINRPEFQQLSTSFRMLPLTREWASNASAVAGDLRRDCSVGTRHLVLVDIGGYFADSANELADLFEGALLGIVEGTENGLKRYERHQGDKGAYRIPIATVARSPLKLPEDYLVASSIVFSIEATLRQEIEILQSRSATVIGYGRVGSAVAEILRNRGLSTAVFDTDPIKRAEAAARGFKSFKTRDEAVRQASLVVCATGNKSLDRRGFGSLPHGCVVASTTSADDEFDKPALMTGYHRTTLHDRLVLYRENRDITRGRYFLLVADGDAANFLDGAVIGPAMHLIEGEKLAVVKALIDRRLGRGIVELAHEQRVAVADIWNQHFL